MKKIKTLRLNKKQITILCIGLMVFFSIAYICGQVFISWDKYSETINTVIVIIGAIAFWLEFKSNDYLNESQFIMELNNQFISNPALTEVEWELEKYYAKYKNNQLTEEYRKYFREKYRLESRERQNLVNYLVHLEGIVAIINNGILHLEIINDLMAYRYFIAVNNQDIQNLELIEYSDFYKGCYNIYNDWKNELIKQEIEIPMEDNELVKNYNKKK